MNYYMIHIRRECFNCGNEKIIGWYPGCNWGLADIEGWLIYEPCADCRGVLDDYDWLLNYDELDEEEYWVEEDCEDEWEGVLVYGPDPEMPDK